MCSPWQVITGLESLMPGGIHVYISLEHGRALELESFTKVKQQMLTKQEELETRLAAVTGLLPERFLAVMWTE